MYSSSSIKEYLNDLAGKEPAPGGGSAAALAGAIGVSLISMVANFTIGKEKYKSFEDEINIVLSSSESLRKRLTELVDEDVTSYNRLVSTYKLPKDNPDDKKKRDELIQEALRQALVTPLEVCKRCREAAKLCTIMAEKGNVNLISDVGVAIALLESAFQSALLNVDINLKAIKDKQFVLEVREVLEPMEKEVVAIKQQLQGGGAR